MARHTRPKIISASELGLSFTNEFGPLGPEKHVTGHHTAGPKDESDAHAKALLRSYHAAHKAKGWGGIGYHFCVTRRGTIICLRPTNLKGAHVGQWNSNNIGVVFCGTTGDQPTTRQARAFRWLLKNAHTSRLPARHRTDRKLTKPYCTRRGHNDWPFHLYNACPGTHKPMILRGGEPYTYFYW